MKRFILRADCSFDAEDLDDAFLRLSEHFRRLAEDENYEEGFIETGEIHLSPKESSSGAKRT